PGARATPAPGTVPDPGEEGTPELVIPAAFGTLLEHRLGRAGHPAMGYAAQVPHYLARTDFPAGALALLRRVSEAAGLDLPLVHLGISPMPPPSPCRAPSSRTARCARSSARSRSSTTPWARARTPPRWRPRWTSRRPTRSGSTSSASSPTTTATPRRSPRPCERPHGVGRTLGRTAPRAVRYRFVIGSCPSPCEPGHGRA